VPSLSRALAIHCQKNPYVLTTNHRSTTGDHLIYTDEPSPLPWAFFIVNSCYLLESIQPFYSPCSTYPPSALPVSEVVTSARQREAWEQQDRATEARRTSNAMWLIRLLSFSIKLCGNCLEGGLQIRIFWWLGFRRITTRGVGKLAQGEQVFSNFKLPLY
jgi:hypothetical protein